MRKIILACASGASTSMLVLKIKEAAAAQGYDIDIQAMPVADVPDKGADADIVLLGPQVRFQTEKVAAQVSCPVEPIDSVMYGMMDGAGVLSLVKEVLGD